MTYGFRGHKHAHISFPHGGLNGTEASLFLCCFEVNRAISVYLFVAV